MPFPSENTRLLDSVWESVQDWNKPAPPPHKTCLPPAIASFLAACNADDL